jgi:hypothetical protein
MNLLSAGMFWKVLTAGSYRNKNQKNENYTVFSWKSFNFFKVKRIFLSMTLHFFSNQFSKQYNLS